MRPSVPSKFLVTSVLTAVLALTAAECRCRARCATGARATGQGDLGGREDRDAGCRCRRLPRGRRGSGTVRRDRSPSGSPPGSTPRSRPTKRVPGRRSPTEAHSGVCGSPPRAPSASTSDSTASTCRSGRLFGSTTATAPWSRDRIRVTIRMPPEVCGPRWSSATKSSSNFTSRGAPRTAPICGSPRSTTVIAGSANPRPPPPPNRAPATSMSSARRAMIGATRSAPSPGSRSPGPFSAPANSSTIPPRMALPTFSPPSTAWKMPSRRPRL